MADKKSKVEISFDKETYTDVSDYLISWEYKGELNNQADRLTIKFLPTIKQEFNVDVYQAIKVYEGWENPDDRLIFKGVITRKSNEYSNIVLDCADEIYKLLKAKKVSVYNRETDPQGGVISAIAEDLMDEVIPTIVEDTGTQVLINQFVSSNKTNVLERVSLLAETANFIILYDPETERAYFVSRGYFVNDNVLEIPKDATQRPKWDKDATKLFNDLVFIGGTTSGVRTLVYNGDSIKKEFNIEIEPSDSVLVELKIGANWVEQRVGTGGVSLTYDVSVDKYNKLVKFKTAPAVGTENVRITLSAQIPPQVRYTNDESIAEYNIGVDSEGDLIGIKMVIIEEDITSNDDASIRAKQLLDTYSKPFYSTSIKLKASVDRDYYYKLGELIQVNDPQENISFYPMIITSVKRAFPSAGAEITIGDQAYRLGEVETDLKKRIERIEARLGGNYEVLSDFRFGGVDIEIIAKSIKISSDSVISEDGIYDHEIYGIWDECNWASDEPTSTAGFILGHKIFGILGKSKLGRSTSNERVIYEKDYEV